MSDVMIAARGLTKRFGKVVALDRVELDVPRGAAFGLVGPAGAGKSTVIRLLAGLLRPTSGSLTLDGAPEGSVASRRRLGVLLQDARLYDWMTAREVLAFAADLGGVARDDMAGRIDVVAGQFRLQDALDQRVAAMHGGARGRLLIAQAVVGDPDVLLLDEPGEALDPDSRRDLLGFLSTVRGRTTVVVAARRFAEVDALCDRVAVMDRGRVTLEAPIGDVRRRMPSVYLIETRPRGGLALEGLVARLRAERWVSDVSATGGTLRVVVTDDDRADRELVQAMVSTGVHVAGFRHEQGSLDDLAVASPRE